MTSPESSAAASAAYLKLLQAEKKDNYRNKCETSPINKKAREFLSYTVWPDQELAKVCVSIHQQLKLNPRNITYVILHPTADGGMPHTRGTDIVCIPAHFPLNKLIQTVRHEVVHMHQKQFPDSWKLILNAEGWKEIPESLLPPEIVSRCRYNPDTIAAPFWAYNNRYIPMPMFKREDKPSIHDVNIRWFDMLRNVILEKTPANLEQRYGMLPPFAWEHPYEIHAYSTEYSQLNLPN